MTIKVQGNVIFDANRVANIHNVVSIAAGGSLRVSSDDSFQGTVAGYASGGYSPTLAYVTVIDKFPFASDTNATNAGSLTQGRYYGAGQSSSINGYTSGGATPFAPASYSTNVIDKFPFAVNANSIDVGDLTQARRNLSGQSSSTSGYSCGGAGAHGPSSNTIDKFPFSTDTIAADVGDLTEAVTESAGQSSSISGYRSGGNAPPRVNTIDKFPFSSDTNATDVGDLVSTTTNFTGQSSTTSGYTSGGVIASPPLTLTNTINKFPFASDTNATDIGDLTGTRYGPGGQSSTGFGYVSGGAPVTNTIEKFSFSADTNATDVGDLTIARNNPTGQQN